ncbi:MAG: hypothetical protein JW882_05605 [Deltaproteobacteria bacterium]|nr:hypothetical protein [Deltaproteobacteria bacterium]
MDTNGILVNERINEVAKMCDRENPIYEQISNFSIALYIFDYFKCSDLLSADDVDFIEAGAILKEHFDRIEKKDVPLSYNIFESRERYLLVIGDPLFPTHFAVIVDMKSPRPYFSKLPFFGSGFDSLEELTKELFGQDGIGDDDFFYYRMKIAVPMKKIIAGTICTFKDNGNYNLLDYQSTTNLRRNRSDSNS